MLITKQRLFSRSGINFKEINQVIKILDFKISSLYDMTPHKTFILESRILKMVQFEGLWYEFIAGLQKSLLSYKHP